jgi:Uma2 family endonuclease
MKREARRALYEEIERLPENQVGEIVGGELFVSPRPAMPHALATSAIGSDLFGRFNGPPGGEESPGGWWILDEPELHLGDDVLVPDLAGWRRERLPVLSDAPHPPIAPDWVCEVLSRSTAHLDRTRKMWVYAREGVGHLWMVDPHLHTLEVYRLEAGAWVVAGTHGGDEQARAEPFQAVRVDLARWWIGAEKGLDLPAAGRGVTP